MKVESLAISRYKIHTWYDRKRNVLFWGIDAIIDGKCYSLKDKKPLFFETKNGAIHWVKKLNKELRDERAAG